MAGAVDRDQVVAVEDGVVLQHPAAPQPREQGPDAGGGCLGSTVSRRLRMGGSQGAAAIPNSVRRFPRTMASLRLSLPDRRSDGCFSGNIADAAMRWSPGSDRRPSTGSSTAPEHSAGAPTGPGLPGSFRNRIVPTPVSEVIRDAVRAPAYDVQRIPGGFRPPGRKSLRNPVHGSPGNTGSGWAGGNCWGIGASVTRSIVPTVDRRA